MQGVFSRSRYAVAAWLVIVLLLAPSAYASDTTSDSSLWAEFMVWLAGRIDIPGGLATPDEGAFMAWLLGRFGVPGG